MMQFEGKKVATLDDLCQAMAPVFQAMGYPAPTAADVVNQLVTEEAKERAVLQAQLNAHENARPERRFLRDERGSAYGYVAAEIPSDLYMRLRQDKQFGPAGLNCPEGLKEVLKRYPACKVKQQGSKYIGTGLGRGARGARGRVKFGPGTLELAK